MRRTLLPRVVALMVVAVVAVAATPLASAKPSPARANLAKAVTTADKQAKKLLNRSAACPAAAAQRATTMRVRAAQTRRLATASPSSLRLRQLRISVHTRRLAVALTRCAAAPAPRAGAPGAPGAPAAPGRAGLPGAPGPAGSDGSSSQRSPLRLDLLGQELDASSLLGGAPLPAVISLVDRVGLDTSDLCTVSGTACVAVDATALRGALDRAAGDLLGDVPLLAPVVNPLLATVEGALASGDLDSLLQVQRADDDSLVVTARPGGALALLTGLLSGTGALPGVSVGDIQVRV